MERHSPKESASAERGVERVQNINSQNNSTYDTTPKFLSHKQRRKKRRE